ncbi:hypothetical protein KJ652_00370 [Patescibacteria group bacterium]|nr:hypothetical protein [Patescibacteria group bacterium]MBU1123027.1 hypothetical protein [Patescibacteria group bacterium]MBU1911061.1 hypothetical protein [Patescibacteria group bacterium]
MLNTIHLTAEEKPQFDNFSDDLKEGWTVEDETIDAYEPPEVLKMRMQMVDLDKYPEALTILERLQSGEKLMDINLNDVGDDILRELAFTIGAKGMNVLIRSVLKSAKTDEDVEGLAGMTLIRHEILETNASISYTK